MRRGVRGGMGVRKELPEPSRGNMLTAKVNIVHLVGVRDEVGWE